MTHQTSGGNGQRGYLSASTQSLSASDAAVGDSGHTEQEAIFAQMEGTVILYGQIIQLLHAHSGNKYLAASSSEAASLEQSCAKIFFRFTHPPLSPLLRALSPSFSSHLRKSLSLSLSLSLS